MKIAVIGTGNVGGTLGSRWAKAGYPVTFGVRDPNSEKARRALEAAGGKTAVVGIAEAAANADVIVLAVPWSATQATIEAAGNLTGKVLVDCTNPIAPGLQLALGATTSGGEQVAQWATGARVVKAFNTTGAENMANPVYAGEPTAMLICGDDASAKQHVSELAASLGFEPLDVGPLSAARFLEPFALVWIRLARAQGLGPNIAFKLARR
jgi:hypothetical protein